MTGTAATSFEAQPFIDGAFVPQDADRTTHDKATGEVIGRWAAASAQTVEAAVAAARRAQPGWAQTSGIERAVFLRAFAQHLEGRREELLDLVVRETGGTREKAEDELWAATNQLYNSASQAQDTAGDVLSPYKEGKLSLSRAVPLGVIGLVTPWNYPLSLAMRAVAPALAFGNTVVLKPAELTPGLGGQVIAEAVQAIGLPPGVVNVVPGTGAEAGRALVRHPGIDLIHFTGSYAVGREIAEHAAPRFARTALELGGDNAIVVLDDADVDLAATCGVWASLWYQGQTCISLGRHIVLRSVAQRYTDAVVDRVRALTVGDPRYPGVDLGPLVSPAQRDKVAGLQEASVTAGATILTGGTWDGAFYQPTVLADVTADMPVFTEETFGPVIPITVVDTVEEAVALANEHRMLMSSIFGSDLLRTYSAAQQIRAGEVHVNDAYARHGGENQAGGFTSCQWIGVQGGPAEYPGWAAGRTDASA